MRVDPTVRPGLTASDRLEEFVQRRGDGERTPILYWFIPVDGLFVTHFAWIGSIPGPHPFSRPSSIMVKMVTVCGLARRLAIYELAIPPLTSLSVDGLEALGEALARARAFVIETTADAEPVRFASMSVADWQRLVDRADHGWESVAC